MDINFGNWLAGFIDGEGCFSLVEQRQHKHLKPMYYPRFSIRLRADDLPILLQIREFLGVGKIYKQMAVGRNAMACYQIDNVKDLMALVRVLEACPVRAKKAKEYEIWRTCVLLKQKRGRYGYLISAYKVLREQKEFKEGSEARLSAPVRDEGMVHAGRNV